MYQQLAAFIAAYYATVQLLIRAKQAMLHVRRVSEQLCVHLHDSTSGSSLCKLQVVILIIAQYSYTNHCLRIAYAFRCVLRVDAVCLYSCLIWLWTNM
jgi:hypothetical protein